MSFLVVHHVSKGRDLSSAEAAMGASTITNLSRSVLVIEPIATSDAPAIGIMPSDAKHYFRLTGAKHNMSPPSSTDRLFKLVPVSLTNAQPPTYLYGDTVATVEPYTPAAGATGASKALQQAALNAIATANPPLSPSSRGANDPIPVLRAAIAPLCGGRAADADAKAILRVLMDSGRVTVGSHSVTRQGRGAYARKALVIAPLVAP